MTTQSLVSASWRNDSRTVRIYLESGVDAEKFAALPILQKYGKLSAEGFPGECVVIQCSSKKLAREAERCCYHIVQKDIE